MSDECRWCKKVKGEDMTDNSLQLVTTIREFKALHDFMDDEELDRALSVVVKLIMKQGEIPPVKAVPLIVELQAISTSLAMKSATYATFQAGPARTPEAHKKNVYYSAKEAINKLVDALKISAKYGLEH